METKHTKGEWRAKGRIITLSNDDFSNKEADLWDHQYPGGMSDPELIANAKLIAAAPELLDFAILVYESFGGGNVITFSERDIEQLKQSIKKATE